MTITHPELVTALSKTGETLIAELTPNSAHCLHMAVGVSGEVGELIEVLGAPVREEKFRVHLIEEIGDLEFYLEGLRQGLDIARSGFPPLPAHLGNLASNTMHDMLLLLAVHSGHLLDAMKKFTMYVKPVDIVKAKIHLGVIDYAISRILLTENITREEVLDHNIAKLMTRYASGSYSNTQAQVRADKPAGE